MAVLKCKMCGGDIKAKKNAAFGTCDSCGSKSTLPKASDERKANLLNRANHFRLQNNFDKALQAYENILNEDSSDSEALWGIVLSKYGIEYVVDPTTHKRIPTCHRVQSESILKDVDYIATLKYAPDEYSRSLYEEEAKKINTIQKGILVISKKEKPYDVFICYKESTDGGSRTKDSKIAEDIYHYLTKEKYCVFFSRITLEDKLGQDYEACIFNALNTAKVMLVISTTKKNFEAVWVKNEWSRFLAIKQKDPTRILIPCYRDLDPYEDIPDELSNLSIQAQDMSKVGFIQDIVRNIKKILDDGKTEETKQSKENMSAIIPKMFTDLTLKTKKNNLKEQYNKIKMDNINLKRDLNAAISYKERVANNLNNIKNDERHYESERKRNKKEADFEADFVERFDIGGTYGLQAKVNATVAKMFDFNQWTDVKAKAQEELNKAHENVSFFENNIAKRENSLLILDKELDDVEELLKMTPLQRTEEHYQLLLNLNKTLTNEDELLELAGMFRQLEGYKDSDELVKDCDNKYQVAKKRREEHEQNQKKIRERNEKIEQERRAEEERKEQVYRKDRETKVREFHQNPKKYFGIISTGNLHTVGLKTNGKVVAVGYNDFAQCNTSGWRNIIAVFAGTNTTFGLKADGKVVAVGDNKYGKCNINSWCDIIAISASNHTVGLKMDGTVVAVGDNEYGKCNTSNWRNIVAVSAGFEHTVGLKVDGTVVAVGENKYGECNINNWRDIIAISAGHNHTAGLKLDGSVIAVGGHFNSDTSSWSNIIEISIDYRHIVGLRTDGNVVANGYNSSNQCNINNWCNIIAISTGFNHTVGLKADGTVIAVGDNNNGQCNTKSWREIGPISEEHLMRMQGLCPHCGGQMSGLFTKKCKSCGK
ncbi:MAG: TIR domain-containing protein [Treponema sp.]|nr:TIR domain-containing protein [Treponema sp.]